MQLNHANLRDISSTPWFDMAPHLHREIQTLDGLNRIRELRRNYQCSALPRLQSHILGGRWQVEGGNYMRFELKVHGQPFPTEVKELWEKIKFNNTAHTEYEFYDFFRRFRHDDQTWAWQRSMGGGYTMPLADVPCIHCGQKWTVETSHDCRIHEAGRFNEVEYPATPDLVGKKLAEVREIVTRTPSNDAKLTMYKSTVLRSDRFIDTTLVENEFSKEMEVRNAQGYATADSYYAGRAELVDWDQYVVQEGDVLIFSKVQYIHPACEVERVTEKVRESLADALTQAGVKIHGSVRIPNGYTEAMYSGAWFIFETNLGMFRIGWRRHVISVLRVQYGETSYDATTFVKVPGSHDQHFDSYKELTEHFKTLK
jgi:hypothetical protein